MSKHLADKRESSNGGRQTAFYKLARGMRDTWHRSHEAIGPSRLLQFLRIARGRRF